jgi:hypothetical protein
MDTMRHDDGDPEEWDVHHWQDINPIHTEALLQLTCGGPQIIYHGGLLHVRLRYFDAAEHRPGLPPDVGALVHTVDEDGVTVTLANASPLRERHLIVQAGAFGEHTFTDATDLTAEAPAPVSVNGRHAAVVLPPGRSIDLRLAMRRYVHSPSYQQPI